ncbi:hypothetical protein DICPUDRAFT_76658 [Dictyostelium purpureum]|uniref:DJ-1/PfpI domain-containing protein n=1 Tax=Dictyostelium purpureum TaxID=5786 RepID=F0ZE93_DICPU|nr:uncharacterized protein DICPUDRAFT_76658 [Dictyostelium purpureum]EGC37733.1 hypothetical protein DICPUDRAFT_76658 [Dictyostelium purpureum]|eukprot:XP_003285754.1 hypothetical protein DICPUDRAFT_76658 [Dictyostelium purpureum]
MTKKILIIAGDYVEDYEVYSVYQSLVFVGYTVHIVSPGKKSGDFIVTAVHDFLPGEQTYTELKGHRVQINFDFEQVKVADYDGFYIPGGRAPEFLRLNERVLEITKEFNDAKKPIAAVCHGAQILTAANVVSGKKCTAYPACKPELTQAGGNYQDCAVDDAVVDGNIVSGKAWPAHPKMLQAFVALLGTTISHK